MLNLRRWRGLKTSPSFFLQVFLIILAVVCISQFQTDFTKQKATQGHISLDAATTSHLILGFKNAVADLFWIRLLQEIDYKESGKIVRGWVFHMLDNVTTLDSRYYIAYRFGAVILSVIVHDAQGAAIIFDRAVKNFPEDWPLSYQAGYHNLFEMKNCARAAELFRQAASHGAPVWVFALSSRLYAKSGQYGIARNVLLDSIEKSKDSVYRGELEKRLKQLDDAYSDPKNTTLVQGLKCGS